MLVVGLGLLGVAGYYAVLTLMLGEPPRKPPTRWSAWPSAAR
jgi:hypothetical protein